jgi:hypothetical protein
MATYTSLAMFNTEPEFADPGSGTRRAHDHVG